MRPRRRHALCLLPALRGCVALMALLGYLACSVGFPAPAPSPARETAGTDEGRPAACRGHACGCTGTDHCCCESQQAPPTPPPADEEACPLCATRSEDPAQADCAECATDPASDSCCAAEDRPASLRGAEQPSEPAVVWVVGFQVRHCRGLDTLWYTFGAVLPLSAPVVWAYDWSPAGWLAPLPLTAPSTPSAPPAPPPRV
jgi:hypothetical protein